MEEGNSNDCVTKQQINRMFSRDVTAAMLLCPTNPPGSIVMSFVSVGKQDY